MKVLAKVTLGVFVAVAMQLSAGLAQAGTNPDELLKGFGEQAKKSDKAFAGFSAEAGKTFYSAEQTDKKGEKISCGTCHTPDPTKTGKTRAGKAIEPMAIGTNPKRFTDKAKVDKWFKRNCQDVYQRECTPKEKGDFVSYMKTAK
jgi:cytochrome c peroxidase